MPGNPRGFPVRLDDGRTLWVLGTYSATRLSLPGLEPSPPVTFKTWGEELTVSPDGQRLYMLNGEYLYTYDLATGQKIKDVRTGRMGMNQHLERSILEIRRQGGVALADGTRLMPDPILVGRNVPL